MIQMGVDHAEHLAALQILEYGVRRSARAHTLHRITGPRHVRSRRQPEGFEAHDLIAVFPVRDHHRLTGQILSSSAADNVILRQIFLQPDSHMRPYLLKADDVRFLLADFFQNQRFAVNKIVVPVLAVITADIECYIFHRKTPLFVCFSNPYFCWKALCFLFFFFVFTRRRHA